MGGADRAIRFLAGIVLLALVFVGPHTPWGWLGVILIATSVIGICPLYSIFKVSTKPRATA